MGKLLRFSHREPPFTLDEAIERIHELAKKSENVFLLCDHAQKRAKTRKASTRQIFDVLRNGRGIDGPKRDKHGDWRVKLKYYTCGRVVQVVVVFKNNRLIVVTVI